MTRSAKRPRLGLTLFSAARAARLLFALAATTVTISDGLEQSDGKHPSTDLGLPTEIPRKQQNVEIGTPTGMTEADCIRSDGTVSVDALGTKVCATKVNAFSAGDVVKSSSRAIEIGRHACMRRHSSWSQWHARFEDGNWVVWNGRHYVCNALAVGVTTDGRTPNGCIRVVCPKLPQVSVPFP